MNHTPGPWKTKGLVVETTDALVICEVEDNVHADYDNSAEINANARLIAAAPALLEAAQDLTNALKRCGKDGDEETRKLVEAITTATGQER